MNKVDTVGQKIDANSVTRNFAGKAKGLVTVTALSIGLAACSSLPDWANPVEWYDSAFNDDAAAPPKSVRMAAVKSDADKPDADKPDADKMVKKEDKKFPALKEVPAKAPTATSMAARKKVTDGLVADRESAKYTDEELRSGGAGAIKVAAAKPMAVKPMAVKPMAKPVLKAAPMPVAVAVTPAAPKSAMPKTAINADPAAPRSVKPRLSRMPKLASASSASKPASKPVAPPPPAPLPPLISAPAAPKPVPVQSAAPMPAAPVAVTAAPLPPLVVPVAPRPVVTAGQPAPSFPTAGQNVLAQVFAASLAQSASTVSTAPAHSTFAAPVAMPLKAGQYKVPNIVLAAYNTPLTDHSSASVTVTPGQMLASPQAQMAGLFTGRELNVAPGATVTIKFANGSYRLSKKARAAVRKAAKAYKARGKGIVRIVGHASHRTQDMNVAKHRLANFGVSLDRANAVARELMRHGIDANVVRVEAKSDADPVFYEYMPAGEAENRRVEIFLGF